MTEVIREIIPCRQRLPTGLKVMKGQPELAKVTFALHGAGGFARALDSRHGQRHQYTDDRNDNQQLYQREAAGDLRAVIGTAKRLYLRPHDNPLQTNVEVQRVPIAGLRFMTWLN